MYNRIFSKVKNFCIKKTAVTEENTFCKITKDSDKHKVSLKKRQQMIAFLNRYSILFHMILACGTCFFIEWVSRHSFRESFVFMFDKGLVFLYNSLIVFASLTLVYFFRRRIVMRIFITVFWLFLGLVNGCVLLKRVTPFAFTDLKMINDLFTMKSTYFSDLEAFFIVVGLMAVLVLLGFLFVKAPKFQGKPRKMISTISLVGFLFFLPMVTDAAVNNNVLADYFENIAQGYSDYGFIYSFSASVVDRGMEKPQSYTQEKIMEITDSPQETDDNTEESAAPQELPNIICVLLESFVDPKDIDFLEYDKDPVPNFHALYENYSSGYLQVPVIGAGTANTEFEILTGMGMQFFGLGEYPYKTVLKSTTCESVAGNLKKLGYGTHAVHNNGGNFYSRAQVFSQMGFDTFTSKELINIQEWTPLGNWPTDHCLIDEVEKTLDSTPNQPDFTYTITVQAHGSYPTESVIQPPDFVVSGAPTPELNAQWEYYIHQLSQVDTFIGDLIEMLSKREEKTMVVFFGDHLPTLELTAKDMVTKSLFHTKYITWNNFQMEKHTKDVTTYQLMPYILDSLNIHEGTMMKFHQNRNYAISPSYEEEMELLQYDLLYGQRYAYEGKDLYPASSLIMGTQETSITSLTTLGDSLQISGENFTPWSKVFVNEKKVSTEFINDTTLKIRKEDLKEGRNQLVVNQMGSGNKVFRSSNTKNYYFIPTRNLSQ